MRMILCLLFALAAVASPAIAQTPGDDALSQRLTALLGQNRQVTRPSHLPLGESGTRVMDLTRPLQSTSAALTVRVMRARGGL